jgi:hypothetical protein
MMYFYHLLIYFWKDDVKEVANHQNNSSIYY